MQIWIFNMTTDCVKGIPVPDKVTLQDLRVGLCMDEYCVRELFARVHKVHGRFIFNREDTSPPVLEGDYLSPEAIGVIQWLAVRRCSLSKRGLRSTPTPCNDADCSDCIPASSSCSPYGRTVTNLCEHGNPWI
jgi:hypothetical protein